MGFLIRILALVVGNKRKRKRFRSICRAAFRNLEVPDNALKMATEMAISTARMNERAFAEFKGCHTGRDLVVVATGPSLEHFKPIDDAVYIGVNYAYRAKGIELDYLFAMDYSGLCDSMAEMNAYRKGRCEKFYGLFREQEKRVEMVIPESEVIEAQARRFRVKWWPAEDDAVFKERFALDLCSEMLASFMSIVFPALQFALWTNPRRIYLVGCDCSGSAHFSANGNADSERNFDDIVQPYLWFRDFAARHYPKTEIVSINPVGLKGVFRDIVQNP